MSHRIEITYCNQCRWLLRAAWMAQELLTTFDQEVSELVLKPATGGIFESHADGALIWSRKTSGRFPDITELKQLVRGLRALGYEIENNARDFEIKHVPRSVIERFSKRHQQIDRDAAKELEQGQDVDVNTMRSRIAHDNRRRKVKDAAPDRLRRSWPKARGRLHVGQRRTARQRCSHQRARAGAGFESRHCRRGCATH